LESSVKANLKSDLSALKDLKEHYDAVLVKLQNTFDSLGADWLEQSKQSY